MRVPSINLGEIVHGGSPNVRTMRRGIHDDVAARSTRARSYNLLHNFARIRLTENEYRERPYAVMCDKSRMSG